MQVPVKQILKKSTFYKNIPSGKDRFAHARELFRESKILNVFQRNILNDLVFIQKSNLKQHQKCFKTSSVNQLISISTFFSTNFSTNFSKSNYSIPPFKLNLNTEFPSEASHYGRTFLQILRKCKKM